MILVASSPGDVHSDAVLRALAAQHVPARLVDLSHFPTRMALSSRYSADGRGRRTALRLPDGTQVDLDEVRAVWWRRPQPCRISPEIRDEAMRTFALSETETALSGVWQSTSCLWVNHLVSDAAAAHKPWQLAAAQAAGLPIPETLVTNDPGEARSFWEDHDGDVVYKPFRQTREAWRETRALLDDDVRLMEAVRLAPVLFQQRVDGVADLRVTVIGDEVFAAAAALDGAAYALDIRFNPGIAYTPHRLPDDVEASLLDLLEALDLEYGAIDLRLTPDGRYVFFEVNPSGQFLYVERSTQQPLTAALAAHLAAGEPSRRRRAG